MSSILEELAGAARRRVEADKARISPAEMWRRAAAAPDAPPFLDALAAPGMSFICECKKASPSKGLIEPDFDPVAIALEYEAAGAAAVSVLTEPTRFLGSDEHLQEVARAVGVPVLRKDFVVDDYMIYQARALGAAAVLLICALHDGETLARRLELCRSIGLDALVEAHDADEVGLAVSAGARVIGVNNRNLADFTVDFGNSLRLRGLVPRGIAFVTESGIKSAGDIALLAQGGVDAVLVGEALMRAPDKRAALEALRAGGMDPQDPPRARNSCQDCIECGVVHSHHGPEEPPAAPQTTKNDGLTHEKRPDYADSSVDACTPPYIPVEIARKTMHAERHALLRKSKGSPGTPLIKICGLMAPGDLDAVNAAMPDYAGFILSAGFRRTVGRDFLELAARVLDRRITRAGVFVDEPAETIVRLAEAGLIDAAQLHGDEDDGYIEDLRALMAKRGATRQVIKAFAVKDAHDLEEAAHSAADLVLLDSGKGTGQAFDWELVEGFPRPFMLAGGLGPGNVTDAVRRVRPHAVDMSSGVETDGKKDPVKIAAAVKAARSESDPSGSKTTRSTKGE